MSMSEAQREPLFHISKRTDISWQKALLIRVIAIALALGASAIICLLLTDDDPLAIYSTIIKGTFGTPDSSTSALTSCSGCPVRQSACGVRRWRRHCR